MGRFHGMYALSMIELLAVGVALCAFVRARAYRSFPAFGIYLVTLAILCMALDLPFRGFHFAFAGKLVGPAIYSNACWIVQLAAAATAFMAMQEILKRFMRSLPALGRLGLIGSRWVAATSVLVAVVLAIFPLDPKQDALAAATRGVMGCISVLALSLLAFIALSMRNLRLSPRSRDFGVAFGLAMIACAELFRTAFAFGRSNMAPAAYDFSRIVVSLAACGWTIYFLVEDYASEPAILPESSPLARWNHIAGAIAAHEPQMALKPSSGFFLEDVVGAVDRVLEKHPVNTTG